MTSYIYIYDALFRIQSKLFVLGPGGDALLVVVIEKGAKTLKRRVWGMASPEGSDVVLEGALVLEVGAAGAVPELATVLLVGSPVALDSERLAALAAGEGFGAVLALEVGLEGAEVLEGLSPGVVDVVLTALGAAIARQPQHRRRLCPFQRVRALPVLRSVAPHVHLNGTHRKECFTKRIYSMIRSRIIILK